MNKLNRQDLISNLKNAANSGTLLIPKHDPNSGISYAGFRTVLTQDASGSLQELINSEKYNLEAYLNKQHNKYSYTLFPYDSSSSIGDTAIEFSEVALVGGSNRIFRKYQ